MAISIKYVAGKTLDDSFFVAADDKGGECVARASHVVPQSLQTLASANKLSVEPEFFIDKLTKTCSDLGSFEKLVVAMATGEETIKIGAAEDCAPVVATEPVPEPKVESKPVVAAESQFTVESKGKGGDRSVAKLYNRLPGAKDEGPEMAVDVQSSIDARIQALSEELKKKDDEIAGLTKKIGDKEKEDELEEVVGILQEKKVDPKEIESIKKDLMGLPEKAIGAIERILNLVCKPKADGGAPKEPPKADNKGLPLGLMPKASEDLRAEANIAGASLVEAAYGDQIGRMSQAWAGIDVASKEHI